MNQKLEKMTQKWMHLERKTLAQRQKAEKFYDDYLMDLIRDDFIRRNKDFVFEEVEYLVISVGTSYEPISLSISLLNPKNILFLFTEKSAATMSKVINYCHIQPTQYEKREVSDTDSMDIYRHIKHAYLYWNKPNKMYIDITGGTKAMSASAAMAGAMVDVQLMYVGTTDYLSDFRKPNPGSEIMIYIENPLAVFGDLEIEKAFELIDKYNFAGSSEKLSYLKENIPEPNIRQQLDFVYLLAKSYEAWDALDFIPACENMTSLYRQVKRDSRYHEDFLLIDFERRIHSQLKLLQQLKEIPNLQKERRAREILEDADIIHALAFTMHQNAETRLAQEKYDMAALLMYRLLEMIEQRRLINYNLYASRPHYEELMYNLEKFPELKDMSESDRLNWLKFRVQARKEALFKKAFNTSLPDPIALLDGFLLLSALGDPIVDGNDLHNSIIALQKIRSMIFLRNNSIFAHGLGPVGRTEFMKFRNLVLSLFQKFCILENLDYKRISNDIKWINPMDSKNYTAAFGVGKSGSKPADTSQEVF